MYMYDIYIQGTQKIHQLTSPHLAQSMSSAQGSDVVRDVSYHAGRPTSWKRSSPHPHHPPHPPQPRRHRYHHPHQHHHHPCEHAPPKDHPNEAPSTTSVPPVSPTAPAVSAAPVPPTAPAVAAAPVSLTAPAPPTASVPPAPPIAPVSPAPVRLSCEWVTRLGVVLSRFYQPP